MFFVGLGLYLAMRIPGSLVDGRAAASAPSCGNASGGTACISAHTGSIDGPYLTLRTGSDWYVTDGERAYGPMSVSLMDGRKLVDGAGKVTGLVWEENLVAVVLNDDTRIEAEANGNRLWYSQLLTSLGLFGLGAGFALRLRNSPRTSAAIGLAGLVGSVLGSATLHVFGSVLASVVVVLAVVAASAAVIVRRSR